MMTRAEHIAWAKQRALQELDAGDLSNAVASITSDLTKHEETRAMAAAVGEDGLVAALTGAAAAVRRWIEGIE